MLNSYYEYKRKERDQVRERREGGREASVADPQGEKGVQPN